jgi:hypothetical protein
MPGRWERCFAKCRFTPLLKETGLLCIIRHAPIPGDKLRDPEGRFPAESTVVPPPLQSEWTPDGTAWTLV